MSLRCLRRLSAHQNWAWEPKAGFEDELLLELPVPFVAPGATAFLKLFVFPYFLVLFGFSSNYSSSEPRKHGSVAPGIFLPINVKAKLHWNSEDRHSGMSYHTSLRLSLPNTPDPPPFGVLGRASVLAGTGPRRRISRLLDTGSASGNNECQGWCFVKDFEILTAVSEVSERSFVNLWTLQLPEEDVFGLQIWAGFQSACALESAEGEMETLGVLGMPAEGEGAY
ncbi:hypothetical protein E1301_Tti003093 [Triplophysa tibetana]|uniref:Uncharacterized protein n=1 Tax=Triplophysa tibetana TaxID=1572043 RepID=A0A5A9PQF2_9TELE|nr:hypothetical protein E1301_Tti003093 [Triplophysa tibetana]